MPGLDDLLESSDVQRLATGFTFTEGPVYHPDGFWYFVDVRESKFYRIKPGGPAELLRENTGEGNGTTFDPQGRLIQCEGGNRRVTRWPADGGFASADVLMDKFDGKRLSRPNDVVCQSDGSLYFTNPGMRVPLGQRELDPAAVYRVMPDGSNRHVADFEYPNGLAFSPDERVLYVANTRHTVYIHRLEMDSAGNMVRRRIFADMSSDEKWRARRDEGRCRGPGMQLVPQDIHNATAHTGPAAYARAIGGLVADIATDPTTYMSAGIGAFLEHYGTVTSQCRRRPGVSSYEVDSGTCWHLGLDASC